MIAALTDRKSITDSERKNHCPSDFMEPPIPNGTYGGVRGRGFITPSYSI
ncbi:hypothetical protein [Aneurinibacillus terranovensis]|nr:hypothetical protein [Aneurinibacillus terranovensis]